MDEKIKGKDSNEDLKISKKFRRWFKKIWSRFKRISGFEKKNRDKNLNRIS